MKELLPTGIFPLNDPRTQRKVLEYISPDLAADFNPMTQEERLARAENVRMLKDIPAKVAKDDKDEIHLEAHNMIIKDIRFQDLPDITKKIFNKHKQDHLDQGADKFMKAQEMIAKMQGNQQEPGGGQQSPQGGTPPRSATPQGGI